MRILVLALLCAATAARADVTLLDRAAILTLDPARPRAEAMAFDEQGKILALGTREELAARYPGATPLDAHGATVVPGLIDAHGHILNLGLSLLRADLRGARSKAEVVERLRKFEASLPAGEWLLGRGWDQNLWPEKAFPTAADLDAAFPKRAVWVERIDGHAGWANSAALARAKRDLSGDWQPDGGRIERANG
jgi:predicted amidohydrolase YtcJ